jgi:hypothetical protein
MKLNAPLMFNSLKVQNIERLYTIFFIIFLSHSPPQLMSDHFVKTPQHKNFTLHQEANERSKRKERRRNSTIEL